MGGQWPATVVVVEPFAHLRVGHFPSSFAELADGFAEAGVHVEVLTTSGWAFDDGEMPRWLIHRYGLLASTAEKTLARITRNRVRRQRKRHRLGLMGTALLAQQALRVARRSPAQPAAVLFTGGGHDTAVLSTMAGHRPFIAHQFDPAASRANDILSRVTQQLREFLRRPPPKLTLVVPDRLWIPRVRALHPGIPAVRLLLAGSRQVENNREEARGLLGIESGSRVALLFGCGHGAQDPETAFSAFRNRPDWLLIIAGQLARRFDESTIEKWPTRPLVMGGFIEPPVRDALYQACDVAVLPFVPDYRRMSGTLLDAVSHGTAVVVSDRSLASEQVEEWGMGEVFRAGSAESLSAALDRIDLNASHLAAVAARDRVDNKSVAIQHLDVFAQMGCA